MTASVSGNINTDQLVAYNSRLAPYAGLLLTHLHDNHIVDPTEIAMFLAQVCVESGSFAIRRENLNYNANALWTLFHRHFVSLDECATYARQPEKIANRVYANRYGNGDEASGDGWKYRGGGWMQTTFKANWQSVDDAMGMHGALVNNPDLILTPDMAIRSAIVYWSSHRCGEPAREGNVTTVTRLINGGLNGIDERKTQFVLAKKSLNIS